MNIKGRFFLAVCLVATSPAFAQLGNAQQKVDTLATNLRLLGLSIATIAAIFIGIKIMFQHAKWVDVMHIAGGAFLVASAPVVISFFVS
jgi:hypothetical protein